jgi:hypothetical protein
MLKKLSFESFGFIEWLVLKYNLEKFLQEDDPIFAKEINSVIDPLEISSIKFFFSKKIKQMLKDFLLPTLPSAKLIKIATAFINKKLEPQDLALSIQQNLEIDPSLAYTLAKEINLNPKIIEDRSGEIINENFGDEPGYSLEDNLTVKIGPQKRTGLSQELE